MPQEDAYAVAELLLGVMRRHVFYVVRDADNDVEGGAVLGAAASVAPDGVAAEDGCGAVAQIVAAALTGVLRTKMAPTEDEAEQLGTELEFVRRLATGDHARAAFRNALEKAVDHKERDERAYREDSDDNRQPSEQAERRSRRALRLQL